MTPEQVLDKNIMLWCGQHEAICFHTNVGKIKFWDEKEKAWRWFDTGLPKGWPDLMIIPKNKPVFYCETKIHPRKPTADQLRVIGILQKQGQLAFVAYSLEEFIEKSKNAI